MPKDRKRRVLIVDDHPIVRQGLRRLIEAESDLEVCGEAETAREAKSLIRELEPDAVIVDVSLKQGDGLELVKDARAHYPSLPLLVLSMHDEAIYAERMLSAGANGYIMKQAASDQFLIALRRVLEGGIYVSEAVGNSMIEKFASGGAYISSNPVDSLTNRELQVLHMIGKGLSTRQTAEALNLSVKTVESHRQRIKRKLSLRTSAQLMQYAVNWYAGREPGQKSLIDRTALRHRMSCLQGLLASAGICRPRRGHAARGRAGCVCVARAAAAQGAAATRARRARRDSSPQPGDRRRRRAKACSSSTTSATCVTRIPPRAKLLGYDLEELLGLDYRVLINTQTTTTAAPIRCARCATRPTSCAASARCCGARTASFVRSNTASCRSPRRARRSAPCSCSATSASACASTTC